MVKAERPPGAVSLVRPGSQSETIDDFLQLRPDLQPDRLEGRVPDRSHGGQGVDGRDLDPAVGRLLDDDAAGQHRADLVLGLERLLGVRGVAGAEDAVFPEVDSELLVEGLPDVDIGQDAEPFLETEQTPQRSWPPLIPGLFPVHERR